MVEEEQKRKRGGGPKTPEGKAVVRRNPIKHGVLALRLRLSARSGQAPAPVIPLVEREEDWQRLRRGVFEWFELEGPLLESLGDRWRCWCGSRHALQGYHRDRPGRSLLVLGELRAQ